MFQKIIHTLGYNGELAKLISTEAETQHPTVLRSINQDVLTA